MTERPRLRAVARLITNSNCVGWAVLIRKLEPYGRVSETPAKAAPARAVLEHGAGNGSGDCERGAYRRRRARGATERGELRKMGV